MATRHQLAPGIFISQERHDSPTRVTYELINETEAEIDMTIELDGSENVEFSDHSMSRTARVAAYQSRYIGTVFLVDPTKSWKLHTNFKFTTKKAVSKPPPSAAEVGPARDRVQAPPKARPVAEKSAEAPTVQPLCPKQPLPAGKRSEKELEPGLTLVRVQTESPTQFWFGLENTLQRSVQLTVDLTGSDNVNANGGGKIVTGTVDPESSGAIGSAFVVSSSAGWSLSVKLQWRQQAPSLAYLQRVGSKITQQVADDLTSYAATPLSKGDDGLTLAQLMAKCTEHNVKFIDNEWIPNELALYSSESVLQDPTKPVVWQRASEIFDGDYKVFADSLTNGNRIEPNDIKQGRLSDCWLLCAISALAEFPSFIERLFTPKDMLQPIQVNEQGVYQVQICKHGEWWTMRLDDLFPVVVGHGPIFARAHGNELWVMLLEKAFAKVAGNYELLGGGLACEALIDLTGCPTTVFRIAHYNPHELAETDKLWKELTAVDSADNLLTASVPGEDKWSNTEGRDLGGPGLVSGHAYALIRIFETKDGHRLLQLRNPWGELEWNGAWSDTSDLWTEELKAEVGFEANPSDGLFWMSFQDFLRHFVCVNACFLRSSRGHQWSESRTKALLKIPQRGQIELPTFTMRVTHETQGWIGLHQEDDRVLHGQPYVDIGFVLLRYDAGGHLHFQACAQGKWERQVFLHLDNLPPATYRVVPITSGHMLPKESARLPPADIFDNNYLSHTYMQMVWEIFRRYDLDMDGYLADKEFALFHTRATGESTSEEELKAIMAKLDQRPGKGVTRDGMVAFFTKHTPKEITSFFSNLGYSSDLEFASEQTVVLATHTEQAVTVIRNDWDSELEAKAMTTWIESEGEVTEYDGGNLKVYQLSRGEVGTTVAVFTQYPRSAEVTVDCSASTNVTSHAGALRITKTVEPEVLTVFHHLRPTNPMEPWKWSFKLDLKM
eukprot:m.218822 g.218822  ORF g.218822 m.218822 type:complete len:950 (-) comp17225_c1_seq7:2973-5822(-)